MTKRMVRVGKGKFLLEGGQPLTKSCLVGALMLMVAPFVQAEEPNDDDWNFAASVYVWGAGIAGDTTNDGTIDIGFSDIIENLDMTYMGTFETRKEKLSFAADVIYLSVSIDNQVDFPVPVGGAAISSNLDETIWIITPRIGYTIVDQTTWSLDLLGGIRYGSMDTTLNVNAGQLTSTSSDSNTVTDVIVGGKGRVNLGENWYLPYYADVGSGDTDLTWQVFGGVGYQFDQLSIEAGYRELEWDLKNNAILDTLNLNGPLLGAKYQF